MNGGEALSDQKVFDAECFNEMSSSVVVVA